MMVGWSTIYALVVSALDRAGVLALVFGGWAEELHGMTPARAHQDIDLLVVDPDDNALDEFLCARSEVTAKRFSHKRAFTTDGVLVELFVVRRQGEAYVSCFWDRLMWKWPADLETSVDGLPTAAVAALTSYRENWAHINDYRTRSSSRC